MNYQEKNKEKLQQELKELRSAYESLKVSYDSDITELENRDEALKRSEEKFRKAFVLSPDSININRLSDGMYISINQGFTRITGYREEDVIGKTSLELNIWASPADRDKLVKGLREKGEVENLETTFLMKNGSIRNGMMSASVIDLDGIPHILSITRDITDRRIAEITLQRSEVRYRELVELAVDGILLGSENGRIIGANSYMLKLTARSLDQLLNMHINELFSENALKNIPLQFDLLKRGDTVVNEREIIRPDGTLIPVEMHTKMMPDGTYQSIYHDISDRLNAEKELRESEEWFRKLFEQSSDGIFYLSQEGKIISVNKSFADMHGYTVDEIMKIGLNELDCPESKGSFHERRERILAGENLKFEVEHFHKDGHRIPLEVSAGMIKMGSSNYFFASHRDITERLKLDEAMKAAREKAEASDRLKTSFLNNISHEVRTPLNGIIGFAEIISNSDLSEAEKDEALIMVHESSDRLLDTITNYMDISLLVSGEMNVYNKEFVPVNMLREIFSKYDSKCNTDKIKILLETPDESDKHWISTDPELIGKVLNHLLMNALKFTEAGTISIGYAIRGSELEFYVSDTGIGIGKESLDVVFNSFVKEDQVKTKPTEGSGLGLSISKGLVELLGGRLEVESEIGKGSIFFFTLPFTDKTEKKSIQGNESYRNKTGILTSILVAEDDEANFAYLQTLLNQNTTAAIIHAANGREAVEKFGENPGIGMILMDIKMPELNGFEATKKIKEMNPFVPVIAITAYAMVGDEKKIREAGCDGYLSKPISKKTLLDKMAEFVKI
jgi:PAS domain S-box-containing protein